MMSLVGDGVQSIANIGDDGGGGLETYEVGKQTMSFTIRFYSSVQSLAQFQIYSFDVSALDRLIVR